MEYLCVFPKMMEIDKNILVERTNQYFLSTILSRQRNVHTEPFYCDIYTIHIKHYGLKGLDNLSFLIDLIYINLSQTIITFKFFSLRMSWRLF